MNILVTGASGKIGKKVLNGLVRSNQFKIFVLSRGENEIETLPGIQTFKGDLSKMDSLRQALANIENIDLVLHMAAITHANNRELYYRVNTQGTKNLLKISEKINVKKFVFISSRAACSGGGDYSESKLAAENEVKKSNFKWLILALGEVYDINGKDEINRLCRIINNYYIVPLIGPGDYKLAPVYLDDAVSAILSALKKDYLNKKRYVVCGSEEFSYKELINLIIKSKKIKRLVIAIPLVIIKFIFWLAFVLRINIISYDQLSRLIVKKPSNNLEAQKDLGFNPRKFSEGLELIK